MDRGEDRRGEFRVPAVFTSVCLVNMSVKCSSGWERKQEGGLFQCALKCVPLSAKLSISPPFFSNAVCICVLAWPCACLLAIKIHREWHVFTEVKRRQRGSSALLHLRAYVLSPRATLRDVRVKGAKLKSESERKRKRKSESITKRRMYNKRIR